MVETALVMMLLMTMLLAVFQFSLAYYAYNYVTYAARDATRYAIVRGSSCSGLSGGCPASADDIQDYLRSNTFPGINPNSMTVSTSWPSAQSQCSPSQSPCNNPGNLVQISVSYTMTFRVPPLAPWTRTVNATSNMVISQ
jgi:Flp pilus assembly protein TadG